jgi:hypothetical protein
MLSAHLHAKLTRFEAQLAAEPSGVGLHRRLNAIEIALSRYIVMDPIEDLGGDPLNGL